MGFVELAYLLFHKVGDALDERNDHRVAKLPVSLSVVYGNYEFVGISLQSGTFPGREPARVLAALFNQYFRTVLVISGA